jgi:diguanylate cyclase (GGDEF)-like protein
MGRIEQSRQFLEGDNLGAVEDVFGELFEAVDQSVAGGYVAALALICLLQYVLYVYRLTQERKRNQEYRSEMDGLEVELEGVQKDRTLSRLENHILREFVSETELSKALELLLLRYTPNRDDGLGAFVEIQDHNQVVVHSRGLADESLSKLQVDSALLDMLSVERLLMLEGSQLKESRILDGLSLIDRGKVQRLFLVAIGEQNELLGFLFATSLYPNGAPLEQQIALAKRLMTSVAGNMQRKQTLETQAGQIRLTSEMLELREFADQRFDTPVQMMEQFLRDLRDKVGADRVALYLGTRDADISSRALARCGKPTQSHLQQRWETHEDRLAQEGFESQRPIAFDRDSLERMGVDTLIGSALVLPLVQLQGTIGTVCISRGTSGAFTDAELELAEWACNHLVETILKALNYAVVERQAQQDSLTKLANRRQFDQRITRELHNAAAAGTECSLLLLDLDHFKDVNDTFGHQAGDAVLRDVAGILMDEATQVCSDDHALTARYGGEEMAILLPGIGLCGAKRIAESIRSRIEAAQFEFQQQKLQVTLSVGIASFPRNASSEQELIAAADAALYQAKSAGRNRVVCVDTVTV